MALFVVALAAVAQAAHWPFYGGDAGRSGYQPLDPGNVPLFQVHANTGAVEDNVQNSLITSGGAATNRFYAFGVEDAAQQGDVHVHDLETGDIFGGIQADDGANDSDTFRGLNTAGNQNDFSGRLEGQGVAFADLTTASGARQFLVVHNDDNQDGTNDISVQLVDADVGVERREAAVPDTNRFTIASSPVLGPLDTAPTPDERDLYFVAYRATQPASEGCIPAGPPPTGCLTEETRLFKVTISNPETVAATATAFDSEPVTDGNPIASPTLTTINGNPSVVQGAFGGVVRSYNADTLAPGPVVDLPSNGDAQTVSAPVNSDGTTPAAPPALFVAAGESTTAGDNVNTRVYRLNTDATFTTVPTGAGQSTLLPGSPSAALAVDLEANQPARQGHVVVTTSNNLYTLDADDLREGTRMSFADNRTAGGTGFSRNTAALHNGFGFVSQDNGLPLVFRVLDSQPLPDFQFERYETHNGESFSLGQPSISARFVQFGHGTGAYVYQLEPDLDPDPDPPAPPTIQPNFSISDASITEGNAGTRQLTFTVALSSPLTTRATVDYATANGTATAPSDYAAAAGRLTFAAGETSKTITVNVNGDTADEDTEQFTVNLLRPVGAPTPDSQGTGTIADDDEPTPAAAPSLVVGDTAISEGDSGRRNAVFTVALSRAATSAVSLTFATADGTAVAGRDYTATRGTVAFAPGEITKTVAVPVTGDTAFERDEQFTLRLAGATGVEVAKPIGTGTIVNDDVRRVSPRGVRVSVSPRRDARLPYRFRVSGQVLLPRGLSAAQACGARGLVSVQYKAGSRTISTRRATLNNRCRFAVTTTFSLRNRLPRSGRLRVTARFQGNRYLLRRNARAITVRTK